MKNENLHPMLVRYLEGRGRWLRAGNDNVLKYLSYVLDCGPGRLDEIRELLCDSESPLYVEFTELGAVSRVGLASWVDNDEVGTEEVPAELGQAWAMIIAMEAELTQLRSHHADVEEILAESYANARHVDHLTEQVESLGKLLERAHAELEAANPQESAALQRKLVNAESALASLRANVANQAAENQQLRGQLHEQASAMDTMRAEIDYLRSLVPVFGAPLSHRRLQVMMLIEAGGGATFTA